MPKTEWAKMGVVCWDGRAFNGLRSPMAIRLLLKTTNQQKVKRKRLRTKTTTVVVSSWRVEKDCRLSESVCQTGKLLRYFFSSLCYFASGILHCTKDTEQVPHTPSIRSASNAFTSSTRQKSSSSMGR